MKKQLVLTLFILLIGMMTGSSFAQDEETEVSFSFDSAVHNKYIWRGMPLTNGPVFQPSATVGIGNFSVNAWLNMDLDNVNNNEFEFNEMDFLAEYGFNLDQVSITVGILHYTFPNTDFDATTEFYGTVSLESPLNPSVTIYQDIDLVEGSYFSLEFLKASPWKTLIIPLILEPLLAMAQRITTLFIMELMTARLQICFSAAALTMSSTSRSPLSLR